MHSPRLLDHFQNPRNFGTLPAPAKSVDVSNPACGDRLVLSATLEAGRIAQVRYQTRGCTASIAAGSALTEWMHGRTTKELAELTPDTVTELLDGLQPASQHAAVLCVDAVRMLLRQLGA